LVCLTFATCHGLSLLLPCLTLSIAILDITELENFAAVREHI
jgi:hypothetical protein